MALKIDDLVLCTVNKIEGTTVFVTIESFSENSPSPQGTIVFSEIAAGRIRNIREHVVPNKKIVCKIQKIYPDHIELSFRRVTASERDSIMEKFKQEQTFKTMLKNAVKNPEDSMKKIKDKLPISDFLTQVKENPKIIQEFFNKEESEKLVKILAEKKEKAKIAKTTIILKSDSNSGITDIKDILSVKGAEIHYLGSSKFILSATGKDFKEANHLIQSALESIQKKAKDKKAFLEIKEK